MSGELRELARVGVATLVSLCSNKTVETLLFWFAMQLVPVMIPHTTKLIGLVYGFHLVCIG